MKEKTQYWIEISDYDLETAGAMLATGRYLYVGFMCLDFIDTIEPLNIEARYPSYKDRLSKSLNQNAGQQMIEQTKNLQQWIKNKL